MVRREGYGRRDGHRCGMSLPQRLGLGGRCCANRTLPCWCRPACYRGTCRIANGRGRCHRCRCHHCRCVSRVKVVVWMASAYPNITAALTLVVYGAWYAVEGRTLFSGRRLCYGYGYCNTRFNADNFSHLPPLTTNVNNLTQLGYEHVLRFRHIFLLYLLTSHHAYTHICMDS